MDIKLFVVVAVMVEALYIHKSGILTMDAIRQFNSIVDIAEDVDLSFVTDVVVLDIWLSTITLHSEVRRRFFMIQAGFVPTAPRRLIEDTTMVTMDISLTPTYA